MMASLFALYSSILSMLRHLKYLGRHAPRGRGRGSGEISRDRDIRFDKERGGLEGGVNDKRSKRQQAGLVTGVGELKDRSRGKGREGLYRMVRFPYTDASWGALGVSD